MIIINKGQITNKALEIPISLSPRYIDTNCTDIINLKSFSIHAVNSTDTFHYTQIGTTYHTIKVISHKILKLLYAGSFTMGAIAIMYFI